MKKVYKYIRHLHVVYGDGYETEYDTLYTSKQRSVDIQNLIAKGFLLEPKSQTWVCCYPDKNIVNSQTHYVRYYKLKYL